MSADERKLTCIWQEDEDGVWWAECDEVFVMDTSGFLILPRRLAFLLCLALAGCAGVTTVHVPLESKPNHIQVTEVRPSWFSTQTVAVIYDEDGKIAGITGSGGRALIDVPLSVLGASATVTGAVILGRSLERAGNGLQMDADVTHRVELPDVQIPYKLP